MKGVAKMNGVAELLTDETSVYMKATGGYKVVNIKDRPLYGYILGPGTVGTLNLIGEETCVIWEPPATMNMSAFEVLRRLTQPIADKLAGMKADNALPEIFSSFDYSAKDLHATARFLIQFWKSTDEQVPELTNLVHPACSIMET